MAQPTGRGVFGLATALAGCTAVRLSGLSHFALAEAKENEAIPAGAGGGPRDRTQRTVSLTLIMRNPSSSTLTSMVWPRNARVRTEPGRGRRRSGWIGFLFAAVRADCVTRAGTFTLRS